MAILTNVTVTASTLVTMNLVSHFMMRVTDNYKNTENKVDDKLNKVARAVLSSVKATNKIFFNRY